MVTHPSFYLIESCMLSFVTAEEDLRVETSYPFNEVTAVFLLNIPHYHHTSHSNEPLSYHSFFPSDVDNVDDIKTPEVLLKLLHVASPLLSPSLHTLQLLMPTKMSRTAWLTSHSILNPTLVRHSVWVSTLTTHNSTCVAPCVNFPPLFLCSAQIRTDQWDD